MTGELWEPLPPATDKALEQFAANDDTTKDLLAWQTESNHPLLDRVHRRIDRLSGVHISKRAIKIATGVLLVAAASAAAYGFIDNPSSKPLTPCQLQEGAQQVEGKLTFDQIQQAYKACVQNGGVPVASEITVTTTS